MTAVKITNLTKKYIIRRGSAAQTTLVEQGLARLRAPLSRATAETFIALQAMDLQICPGEVVGVIGRNGAGKSTLLKLLSRITAPTAGRIELNGRVGSLLEVGTGFHPELSGRENIFLNGSILGMTRPEIHDAFNDIVEFAGVQKFLDTPVKRYSSGMYVRLAFAVAANLRTEILLVDEVLAVGDIEFQQKCISKMQDIAEGQGRTILFVSHQLHSIRQLCSRAIYLEQGRLKADGEVDEVLALYESNFSSACSELPDHRAGSGEYRFTRIEASDDIFRSGVEMRVDFAAIARDEVGMRIFVSGGIYDSSGMEIVQLDSRMSGGWVDGGCGFSGSLLIRTPWLKPGRYRLAMVICSAGVLDRVEEALIFQVSESLPYDAPAIREALARGLVLADFNYRLQPGNPTMRRDSEETRS